MVERHLPKVNVAGSSPVFRSKTQPIRMSEGLRFLIICKRRHTVKEFATFHPIVNFAYFTLVIVFSCIFMHPGCVAISLACSFVYSVMLGGKKQLKINLFCILPMMIISALINPAFNHSGITILAYLPGGNPLTLESIVYGIAAGMMLGSIVLYFNCCTRIMTSDKFIYLFGKAIPTLSLLLSMTIGFMPKFKRLLSMSIEGQKSFADKHGFLSSVRTGSRALSAAVTMSLDDAAHTADSMKGRGYGLPGRTAYSNYRFDARDLITLCIISICAIFIICGIVSGTTYAIYIPYIRIADTTPLSVAVFAAYLILCILPVVIELWEVIKWRS